MFRTPYHWGSGPASRHWQRPLSVRSGCPGHLTSTVSRSEDMPAHGVKFPLARGFDTPLPTPLKFKWNKRKGLQRGEGQVATQLQESDAAPAQHTTNGTHSTVSLKVVRTTSLQPPATYVWPTVRTHTSHCLLLWDICPLLYSLRPWGC